MTTIFYLTGILVIFFELAWIFKPQEKVNDTKKFMDLSKLNEGKKWDDYSEEYKSELKSKILHVIIPIWILVGMFTVQWTLFLAILLFNIFIIQPLSRLTRYNILYTVIHWVNSVIGFVFSLFVIINHYHLHLDLTEYFKQLIR